MSPPALTQDDRAARAGCAARRAVLSREHRVHGFRLDLEAYTAANLRGWASLLDLGAGAGEFLLEVRRRWHHQGTLVGLDCDSERLAGADGGAALAEAAVRPVCAEVRALPFEDECFDGVLCRHPLRTDNLPALLDEIRRVVRPAGRVVMVTASKVNFRLTREFLRRASLELPGLTPRLTPAWPCAEEMVAELLPFFGPVEHRVKNDVLYFRKLERFLAFFETWRDTFDPLPDDQLWAEACRRAAVWAPAWFETRHAISEPESYTVLVATVL